MSEKSPKNIKNTYNGWLQSKNVNCWFVPGGILGNLLMTLIDLVNKMSEKSPKNMKNTYKGWI